VSGAVAAPDAYELPAGARVKDLVVAAGGLTVEADQDVLNLAARLTDGQHIHVAVRGAVAAPGAPDTAADQPRLIDLNTATLAELDALPGVGKVTAERIIAYRETNGPFLALEDIGKIKGIGAALAQQIAALVTVGP
jgi:competence protein ComEA